MKIRKIHNNLICALTISLLLVPAAKAERTSTYTQTSVYIPSQTKVCSCLYTLNPSCKQNSVLKNDTSTIQTRVCTIPTSLIFTKGSNASLNAMENELIRQVNAERARYGLAPLSVNADLSTAAAVRAEEIVRRFSHTRPDGSSWSTVSSAAFGENIAKGHSSVDRVMAAWLTSQGHRKNILRESFGSIGVSALRVNGIMYWVQLFGR